MKKSSLAAGAILALVMSGCSDTSLPSGAPYTEVDMQRCMEPYLRVGVEAEGRTPCMCAVYHQARAAHDWEVSPELCNVIPGECEDEKNDCANELGEHFKDRGICSQLQQEIDVSVCKAGVAFWVSDISLCESIPSTHTEPPSDGTGHRFPIRDECFQRIAEDTKDLVLCERIEDKTIKEICENDIRFGREE